MIATIFGGNGFIGSRLAQRLLAAGHHVRIYDRSSPTGPGAETGSNLLCYTGDFSNEIDFSRVIEGSDVVFHLISTTLPSASNAGSIADVEGNLIPTLRLLDQMSALGISRLIFPSSGGTVYGESQYLPIDEQHPTQPIVSYGATKLAIEKYLAIYRRTFGLRPVCLRISNPYGPGFKTGSPQGALGAFLHKALNNHPIEIWGTGEIRRDYLYIEDLVDAMLAAANFDGDEFIFNISTGIGTSLIEALEIIQQVTGKKISISHRASRNFDVQTNILDNSLARRSLNWSPKTGLMQGIKNTATWLQG